jgi:hypothetical protein
MQKTIMTKLSKSSSDILALSSRQCLVLNFENKLKEMSKNELDLVIKKLNFLCHNFDPYDDHKSTEVENIISEFELDEFTSNPFEFTNVLLQILDKTENNIKTRVQ